MKAPKLGNKLELMTLKSILKLGDEAYGLSVRHDIHSVHSIDYSIGAIYTTLARLEKKAFISSRTTKPLAIRGGRSRRQFKITALGESLLAESEALALRLWGDSIGASVCVVVTIGRYNLLLGIANIVIGMLSGSAEGTDPITINWSEIVQSTMLVGALSAFVAGFILGAFSRITPMVSVMLLSLVLVIISVLIPLFNASVWPLWSFIAMPLAIAMTTQLGAIAGLLANRVCVKSRLYPLSL